MLGGSPDTIMEGFRGSATLASGSESVAGALPALALRRRRSSSRVVSPIVYLCQPDSVVVVVVVVVVGGDSMSYRQRCYVALSRRVTDR